MAKKNAKKPVKKEKEIISKTALIERVAKTLDGAVGKKDVATVVNTLLAETVEAVRQGDEIRLIGFGTFKTVHRNARSGRNPQTGEPIEIKASDAFGFKSNIRF